MISVDTLDTHCRVPAAFVPNPLEGVSVRSKTQLYKAALLAASVLASVSYAQGNSVITGTVTDAATGKPVSDVVVTATSPALQGEEVVVTDSSGTYRISQLPPGTYTVKLEKESFKLYNRAGITLNVDRTVRVNIQMQPEAVQGETVTIVGKPPTVDVGSTTTGVTVGKDFIDKIGFIQPNGNGVRSFDSLASVAPQVIGDDFGFGFSGAQSPENLYLVDGVSVSDPAFGTNGAQFPVEFVEEANVITGSFMPEYGRATGGVLNVTTKSGSNEFHGAVWGNWTPGVLTGVSPAIKNDSSVIVTQGRLWNSIDLGAEVGGPIIKDRLWFFVGFSPSFNRTQTTRSLRRFLLNSAGTDFQYDDDGFVKAEDLAGTTQAKFSDSRSYSYIAKLTFLINSDNNVSVSVVGSPTTSVTPTFTQRRLAGALTTNNTASVSVKYTGGFLDKHLLVDASFGWFHIDGGTMPSDGSDFNSTSGSSTVPAVTFRRENADAALGAVISGHSIAAFETLSDANAALCEPANYRGTKFVNVRGSDRFLMACPATSSGTTYTIGGFGFMQQQALDRIQGRASVTYLAQALGHHIVKAGLDIEQLRYDIKKGYSGGDFLRQNITGTRFDDFRQYGYLTAPDEAVQQKFIRSIPTSTGTAAYLQDSWTILDLVTLNAGLRYENQQLFGSDGNLGMTLNNMISPRVGVIYDFTQQGRSKLYANYARYYEAVPIDIADRSLTGENQFGHRRNASKTASRPGCDPLADISQANDKNFCLSEKNYSDLYFGSLSANVNRFTRLTGAGKTPVDPNLNSQSTDELVFGGEYEIISDGRVGATYTKRWLNYVIEDMSLDEGSTYFIGNPGYGLGQTFPKATRDYDAVTLSFTKAFADGWMGQASYTYSSLRGNYNGLFRPETGQLDPNINSDFDLISLMANRTGPLDADRNHFIKAFAAKEFVVSGSLAFNLGVTYTGQSGAPINYLASHPLYGAGESFVLPRGAGGRLPWRHSINLKAGVSYKISKDNMVQFSIDAFNVLNFQAVTAVDDTFSTKDLLPATIAPGQNPQQVICIAGNTATDPNCKDGNLGTVKKDGTTQAKLSDVNPNFKRPAGYQTPISLRFGVKVTF